jgi:hypothetical protein
MRVWSLHPKYLDPQGLVALWREGLLAKKVLEGKTRGYRHHPQLIRFKNDENAVEKINCFLHFVCDEADRRGYQFARAKLAPRTVVSKKMLVTTEQLEFERQHLLKKQFKRSRGNFFAFKKITKPEAHPLFKVIAGPIESWEVRETR